MGNNGERCCCGCGKKLGLLSLRTKLSDGSYLCSKCKANVIYTNIDLLDVHFKDYMTADNYEKFVQMREINRELVADFNETHKFFDCIHIDFDQNQIIFLNNSTFKNKRKLLEENPTVFSAADLAYWCTNQGSTRDTSTVTGRARAEADVYHIFGFESPIYEPIKIKTGKVKAEAGFLHDSVTMDPKIMELHNILEMMRDSDSNDRMLRDEFAPARDLDSILKMVHTFKKRGYMTAKDVKHVLDSAFDGNRADIKEAKKMYDL